MIKFFGDFIMKCIKERINFSSVCTEFIQPLKSLLKMIDARIVHIEIVRNLAEYPKHEKFIDLKSIDDLKSIFQLQFALYQKNKK